MGVAATRLRVVMVGGAAALLAGVVWAGDPGAGSGATQSARTASRESGGSGEAEKHRAQYWLGVAVENIPPTFSRQLKLNRAQGLMVLAVLRDSPAERAGVRADDLLIEIEGEPLTTQEQLARAANREEEGSDTVGPTKGGAPAGPRPKKCHLTLLRDGDRVRVEITPAPRPASMMVAGGGMQSFTLHPREGHGAAPMDVRNIVLPNGSISQVGPGYRMDLSARGGSALTEVSIRQLVGDGETIILTQEQDEKGGVKNSITVGGQKYMVEPGKVASLPEKIRPIAEQLLAEGPAAGAAATRPGADAETAKLDQRVKDLEKRNAELQDKLTGLNDQLSELIRLLKEKNGGK
ncbi:MAG TPA: PDZ domain-containing protein [Phycisphaerae bacterium]|nr:PDZ domain-containing protein [Phycisphaerae bacterium]